VLISENDVELFARVSGDRNPLHCSREYARATPFGTPVAHGVLAVLATIDELRVTAGVSAIEVEFGSPVYPGVTYRAEELGDTGYRLLDGERVCLTVRIRPGAAPDLAPVPAPPLPTVEVRTIADLPAGTEVTGDYGPTGLADLAERFPAATRLLGPVALTCLLWASYVAGMRLPGERCLLGRVALRFAQVKATEPARLAYRAGVAHTDPRFGLVSLDGQVTAAGEVVAEAEVEALVRTPAPLPSATAIGAHLPPSSRLRGRSAAVVGGSRGLGAAVSLALASQGCEVFVGHRGPFPDELRAEGLHSVRGDAASPEWSRELRSRVDRLDVLVCAAAPPIRALDLLPTHLQRVDEFLVGSLRLVSAPFAGLLDVMAPGTGRCLVISSSAVAEPPRDWPHYVAAKSAVEGLVSWAARHHPDVGFLVARPGMLRTEQMNSPSTWERAAAVEPVAAELVRLMLDAEPTAGTPLTVVPAAVPLAGQQRA
jgi:NAD(P)-dependent dehydrogenase (short-subunit alcohol dehydrogenase family)